MICTNCNTNNRDNARFCNNCGNSLSQPATPPIELPIQAADQPVTSDEEPGTPSEEVAMLTDDMSNLQAQAAPSSQSAAMIDTVETATEPPVSLQPLVADEGVDAPSPAPIGDVAELADEHPTPSDVAQVQEMEPVLQDERALLPHIYLDTEAPDNQGVDVDEDATDNSAALATPRLVVQDWVAMRYRIISDNASAEGDSTYSAQDWGFCPTCQASIAITEGGNPLQRIEEEPYCDSCGSDLRSTELVWPVVILQEVAAEVDAADPSALISDGGRFFVVTAEEAALESISVNPFPVGVSLLAAQRSDVGIVRAGRADEDSCFCFTFSSIHDSVALPTVGVYIVADGMGGHGDGEIASRIAVETIAPRLVQGIALPILQNEAVDGESVTRQIREAVQAANQHILDEARVRSNDMGTTVTLAVVINTQLFVANVGDSRTYLWGKEGMQRITNDHSVVFNLMKAGQLTEDDLYDHPRRSEIYRSLGFQPKVEVDQFEATLTPGDLLLLCCDGLWEMLRTDGINDVLMLGLNDPQAICDRLVRRANEAGGEDNISVIVVRSLA